MTDPEFSERTYIEPLTVEAVTKIIAKERPDAILPTLGGQTGLNIGAGLWEAGVLEKYGVEMLGANYDAIHKAEDRQLFKDAVRKCGLGVPESSVLHTMEEAEQALKKIGLPMVIRPSFTMGGTGGGMAYTEAQYREVVESGLRASPTTEVLVEESVEGWKEFELEVMRDCADNVVIVCSIENFDAMGVHTGDSITVAPIQTLTDKEYQVMRNAALAIIREIGVETGGSNIQFATDPKTGRMIVIEMNPRVSRSSALASKATGFAIAKIATRLAVGYTLDEIQNDITRETPACFEPSIDYCVVKIPKFNFEKFPEADATLTTQMKSVGEVMSIGRTFKESIQKALRSLEAGTIGFGFGRGDDSSAIPLETIEDHLKTPNAERIFFVRHAFRRGMTVEEINEITGIDPWFLDNIEELAKFEDQLAQFDSLEAVPVETLREAKRLGYGDAQLAVAWNATEMGVRAHRLSHGVEATFKLVDTCAAEFEAYTPYFYSTYESEDETRAFTGKKAMILGGGPNRIGQGIEFDYCCVHAAFALRESGWGSIMVNSNPETVSTDYDTSDKLYFEPLTLETVLNIFDREKPDGVILQLGGQTPLNLAKGLEAAGVPVLGTSPSSIHLAEDREQFNALLNELGIEQPPAGTALNYAEAQTIADRIGYPVLVRPSFVLGGRAMEIVWSDSHLERYVTYAETINPGQPILIDKYIEEAIEVDVDCISDGEQAVVAGIMEHIEEAGVHSGDSSCALPPHSLNESILAEIRRSTKLLAEGLKVRGLMNVQYAIKGTKIYVIEANPRASRTIPFVSKTIGVPLAKLATKVMIGETLKDLGFEREVRVNHMSIKKSVFPFNKFPGSDIILGPEMKSTGEVMGIDDDFGMAFAKAHMSASQTLPLEGKVFISVAGAHKKYMPAIARDLIDMGFKVCATPGTKRRLHAAGIEEVEELQKIKSAAATNVLDLMDSGDVKLVINTPSGREGQIDEMKIRAKTIQLNIPCLTTIPAARAAIAGIRALRQRDFGVRSLQDYFPE